MKIPVQFVFTLLLLCFSPLICQSADQSDAWSPALRANIDRLVQQGQSETELESVSQAMLEARFTEEQIIQLQNSILQAESLGLPIAPLHEKILEGIAKHAPAPTIILAVERFTSRYQEALRLAAQLTVEKKLVNQWGALIATGNAAGLPFADMGKILQQVQHRSTTENDPTSLITETLTTARDMARQTVTPESITEIISIALAKGFNGSDMQELNRSFSNQARRDSLATVTQNCLADLQRGHSPGEALHSFGTGNRHGGGDTKNPSNRNLDSARGTANETSSSSTGSSTDKSGSGGNGGGSGGNGGNGGNGHGR